MLSLKDIVDNLKKMSYVQMHEMAAEIDVSFDTLRSIRIGRNTNPRLDTVIAISGYLTNESQRSN